MKELIIQKDDADQRVDKFILKTLKTMPKSLMYKYIRNKKIKVNKKRCEISQRLQEGDTIQCYIAESFFDQEMRDAFLHVPSQLDIIYEDEQILLVNKPQGLLAHSDVKAIQDNLADRILHYLYDTQNYHPAVNQSFTPALVHRIDRNTQGIVIAAKTAPALRFLNEKIRKREIEKKYICIVEGKLAKKQERITLYHKKLEGNKVAIRNQETAGYQSIQTAYRVLSESAGYSLLEIDLLTGKSHQIRAVMAFLHHPIYGDVKYGAKRTITKEYQALCAYKIHFNFTADDPHFGYLNGQTFQLKQIHVLDTFKKLSCNQEKNIF